MRCNMLPQKLSSVNKNASDAKARSPNKTNDCLLYCVEQKMC